jgi:hypothetical protein
MKISDLISELKSVVKIRNLHYEILSDPGANALGNGPLTTDYGLLCSLSNRCK